MGRPGKSRVEPPIEILTKHFLRDVTDIEKDVQPLAALGFMAGYRISVFYLDDVLLRIYLHLLPFSRLGRNVLVIVQYGVKELVV